MVRGLAAVTAERRTKLDFKSVDDSRHLTFHYPSMLGNELLESIHSLPRSGASAAILRHAERFPITDPSEPTLAEITPSGAEAAEAFGRRIEGFDCLRLFHSPIKRCGQTAECIARGAQKMGMTIEMVGAQAPLGVDYIQDLVETGRLNQIHGEHFVRLWFTRQVSKEIILHANEIAAAKLAYITERLQEPSKAGRRLDLHVSHDWNVLILRELMLGVRHEDTGWLTYLDGVAFSLQTVGLQSVYRDRSITRALPWLF